MNNDFKISSKIPCFNFKSPLPLRFLLKNGFWHMVKKFVKKSWKGFYQMN